MLDAMKGFDKEDALSFNTDDFFLFNDDFTSNKLERVGVFKSLLEDSLYVNAIELIKQNGASIIEIEAVDVTLNGFLTLLNIDMRNDLPNYLKNQADATLGLESVQDVIEFNKKDSTLTMPYGQSLFYGIVNDATSDDDFKQIKDSLHVKGKHFFDVHFDAHNLDVILSINNYHAAQAAVAIYPAITVPMGYAEDGKPEGLTFISNKGEKNLLDWAYDYEQLSNERIAPKNYD